MTLINSHRIAACSFVLTAFLAQPQLAVGQSESAQPLRQARGFFALPVELDIDRGAANGNAAIMRVMPLYKFPLGENMELANLTILTFADAPGTPAFPGAPGAEKTTGVADLLHASFFTPKSSGNVIWGVGPILSLPTATDPALGSEKWSLGPALVIRGHGIPRRRQPAADSRRHSARAREGLVFRLGAIDQRELGPPGPGLADTRRGRHRPHIRYRRFSVGVVRAGLLQRRQSRPRPGLDHSVCDRFRDSVRGLRKGAEKEKVPDFEISPAPF